MKNNVRGIKVYLLIGLLLILAIVRISTLQVHANLPHPSRHQDGYYDYEGVIHWHTNYSGGALGTYQSLEELGNQNHLDFLITTEHNNLKALKDKQEGWHGRMLTLVGIESSRLEGYLLGLNMHAEISNQATTDEFLSETFKQGGYTLIAHPRNPRPRWHWRGKIDSKIVGQEIIDLTDQFTTASPLAVITGFLYYPFNKPAAYIQLYQRPVEALRMWDEINAQRHFIGVYAPDVHQSIRILGKNLFRFPTTQDILPIGHNHVVLHSAFTGDFLQDKITLDDAIKKGQLFVAIDSLEDATGFFFSARQGDKIVWMGDQLVAGKDTDFSVRLPEHVDLKNTVIKVFHNGEMIARHPGSTYTFKAALPGAYRIETEVDIPTFWGFNKSVVWIYSNPIYLR